MTAVFAGISRLPFDLSEIFLAIFVGLEPIRELQKVLSFKLLFDYIYMHLNYDLYIY